MKRWTVVLMTKGHWNHTGEYVFAVRADTRQEAEYKAQEVFKQKDTNSHKPSRVAKRKSPPRVKEVVCWS